MSALHEKTVYLIPGQDKRSRYIAEALTERGCRVMECAVAEADVIILPMGLRPPQELLELLRPGQHILGGRLDKSLFDGLGVQVSDYYADPILPYINAVPTAEGAIEILMQRLLITIQGSCGLIVGYGRIGCCLAEKLHLLGSDVTVAARKAAGLGRIEAAGLKATQIGEEIRALHQYDYIINTAPAPVFSDKDYECMRQGCLLLELASSPGGLHAGKCRALGLEYVNAPGLPGKCAPKTAGYAIADAIQRILKVEAHHAT